MSRACGCACSTAHGGEIDPKAVDWQSDRSPNFTIRQDAGAGNALGALRIDMPNPHAVYMHDTNHKELLQRRLPLPLLGLRARRRGARSRDLAAGGQSGLGPRELDAAIATGQSTDGAAGVQGAGRLGLFHRLGDARTNVHFRDDIYGHEPRPACRAWSQAVRPVQTAATGASGFVLQSDDEPTMKLIGRCRIWTAGNPLSRAGNFCRFMAFSRHKPGE